MKRLIFLLLALLVAGSAGAATKVQVMTDGVIDVDRLPTISFFQENDPSAPELGQIWWNNATNQLKVAGALGVYAFNSTSLVEWDTTPGAFSFTDVTNATTNSTYVSDPITVSGINWPAPISVSGDTSAKYSINNATATVANGTVASGDEVRAVVTSSASDGAAVNATVTIGGVSDAYSVATASTVTYLVDEDFEGTGTPSGWTKSANADFDYTTSPIDGGESLFLPSMYGQYARVEFAQQDGQHSLFFAMKAENWSAAAINYVAVASGASEIFTVRIRENGFGVRGGSITSSPFTSATMPDAQIVYFWLDFDTTAKTASLYYSATNEKPQTASASVTGDQSITTVDNIVFYAPATTGDSVIYDMVSLQ